MSRLPAASFCGTQWRPQSRCMVAGTEPAKCRLAAIQNLALAGDDLPADAVAH